MFWGIKHFMQIRVSPEAELDGVDSHEFGSVCYPEFVLATGAMGSQAPGHDARDRAGEPEPAYVSRDPNVSGDPTAGGDA